VLPPGTYVPVGTVFPEGWTYGDPLPDGIYLPAGFEYGTPFTPDVSLPYNFTVSPGTVFPSGWKYGDPLPFGVSIPAGTIYGYPGATGCPTNFDLFPPGRPAPAGATSPPASGGFVSLFDETYWKTDPGSMGTTTYYVGPPAHWRGPGPECKLIVNGTWNVDFRPTKLRITDNWSGTRAFWLKDTDGDIIAQYSGSDNPFTINLLFPLGKDLSTITWMAPIRAYNFEFYS